MPLYRVEQLPAQIVGLQQMAEAAYRRFVRHWLAAEINADEIAHHQRIVECLFHRRVRQVEPLLQEIDPQHPLHPDRRAAIAGFGIERLDQPAQRRPRHHPFHLGQKYRPPRRLGVAFKTRRRQRQLLHRPPTYARQSISPRIISRSLANGFCRGSLTRAIDKKTQELENRITEERQKSTGLVRGLERATGAGEVMADYEMNPDVLRFTRELKDLLNRYDGTFPDSTEPNLVKARVQIATVSDNIDERLQYRFRLSPGS